jgi:hypothetical protein
MSLLDEARARSRGNAAAPKTAPTPTPPSSSPYPPEPRCSGECATKGNSAQIELAKTMNNPARSRMTRSAGLDAT